VIPAGLLAAGQSGGEMLLAAAAADDDAVWSVTIRRIWHDRPFR